MQIRCKKCGTRYFIKDELITEEGIKVRCSKCGTTFIVRKKKSPSPKPKAPSQSKPKEPEIDPTAYLELTKEESFAEEFKKVKPSVKLLFVASVLAVIALLVGGYLKYTKIKVLEKSEYAATALKYGYIEDAIEELKELLSKDPDNPTYNFLLAQAYYILGSPKAKAHFFKAAQKTENDALKGSLLVRAGRISEGIALLKNALLLSNDSAAVSNDLGVAYLLIGNTSQGLQYLKDASGSYPFEALFNEAVFFLKKEMEKANTRIEKLYSLYPGKVEVMINTAVYYAKKKEYAKALQLLFMARGEHMFSVLVRHNIRVLYQKLHDERYRAYLPKDIIKDDQLHLVNYKFLLNPKPFP